MGMIYNMQFTCTHYRHLSLALKALQTLLQTLLKLSLNLFSVIAQNTLERNAEGSLSVPSPSARAPL